MLRTTCLAILASALIGCGYRITTNDYQPLGYVDDEWMLLRTTTVSEYGEDSDVRSITVMACEEPPAEEQGPDAWFTCRDVGQIPALPGDSFESYADMQRADDDEEGSGSTVVPAEAPTPSRFRRPPADR